VITLAFHSWRPMERVGACSMEYERLAADRLNVSHNQGILDPFMFSASTRS
jgi:hypothetical protein